MLVYLILILVTGALATQIVPDTGAFTRGRALNGVCLCAIFCALFAVGALRLRVGNDYAWYESIMNEIDVHGFLPDPYVPTESGFNLIVWLVFRLFGYQNTRAVFALMSFATVFFFLRAIRRQSDDFFLSFLMLMCLGLYFQSFSTVRYYVALPMALLALPYCQKGDWPRFVLLVLGAALIHKSALCVLVFYPLARLEWNRIVYLLAVPAGLLFFFFPAFWMRVALRLYPSYQNATDLSGDPALLNIIRCLFVLALVGWNLFREQSCMEDKRFRTGSRMTFMALILYLCASFLPQLSRIAFYLTTPQILFVPSMIRNVRDGKRRRIQQALLIVFCALCLIRYLMTASDEGIRVLPYRSVLFHE